MIECKFDIGERVIWNKPSKYIKEGEIIMGTIFDGMIAGEDKTHLFIDSETRKVMVSVLWDNGSAHWEEESDLTSQRYIRDDKLKELGL